jgi:hypothetical protein
MDFTNREIKPQSAAPGAVTGSSGRKSKDKGKWGRIGLVASVAVIAIMIVGLIGLVATNDGSNNESKYVDSKKLQAVFLNTGQVYFGNIKSLNKNYFVLSNIYYLQTASNGAAASSNSNVTLVKLGCELHEPFDQMVINSDQVTFWENLQDNGQVAKAVSSFKQQNPQGQKCADQSSSSSNNSSSSVQSAGSSSTPTTSTKP